MLIFVMCVVMRSQITGFDSATVQKGSTKTVAIDSSAFAQTSILEMLYVATLSLALTYNPENV